jgi:oxalate---CoA ligase
VELTIPALLRDVTDQSKGRIALVAPWRDPLSYEDLVRQANITTTKLRACGVSQGDTVALVLPDGPEMVVAFLAAASVGVCAPLNPSYRAPEFEMYLDDLAPSLIIVERGSASPARSVAAQRNIPVADLHPDRTRAAASVRRRGGNLGRSGWSPGWVG